jgi:hypothetical protein
MFAERCSAAILDGLLDKMGDLGVSTISCLIRTQKFDQDLCDIGASVGVMPKVIYDQLNQDSLIPTSMHLQLADQWCHTPFQERGNEASICVPRMFKSHAWQQLINRCNVINKRVIFLT